MKWPEVQFADIAEIVTGNTPPKKNPENYGSGVPWVKPPDLDGWEPVTQTSESLSPKGQKLARLLPKGTVMVCCIGSIGRVGIAGTTLATNQQINSLIFGPQVEPKFGYYYCRWIPHLLQAAARNAVVPILNKSNFSKLRMPLPVISEQLRIVEILDQADALRKKRAEADSKAARILPALFYKMFGDPVQDNSDAFQTMIDCSEIIMGQSPPGETYNQQENGLPFFQGKMEFGSVNPIVRQWCSSPSRIAEPGDVLLSVRAPVGPTNIANVKCAIGRGLAIIRPIPDRSTTEFLFYSLRAIEKNIARIAQGSTFTAIRRQDVERIRIPKARIQDQSAFSLKARAIQGLVEYGVNSRTRIERIFEVLLHRAFSGNLTAKWREAHMKELLAEMEEQARPLKLDDFRLPIGEKSKSSIDNHKSEIPHV